MKTRASKRVFLSDTIASQPPIIAPELERNLDKMKEKVIGVYKRAKKTPQNWTSTQKLDLKAIKEDENIIIKNQTSVKVW